MTIILRVWGQRSAALVIPRIFCSVVTHCSQQRVLSTCAACTHASCTHSYTLSPSDTLKKNLFCSPIRSDKCCSPAATFLRLASVLSLGVTKWTSTAKNERVNEKCSGQWKMAIVKRGRGGRVQWNHEVWQKREKNSVVPRKDGWWLLGDRTRVARHCLFTDGMRRAWPLIPYIETKCCIVEVSLRWLLWITAMCRPHVASCDLPISEAVAPPFAPFATCRMRQIVCASQYIAKWKDV